MANVILKAEQTDMKGRADHSIREGGHVLAVTTADVVTGEIYQRKRSKISERKLEGFSPREPHPGHHWEMAS